MTIEVFPLGTKILAAEKKKERTTASGIFIGDSTSIKESSPAKILAVGPDVKNLRVGDEVYIDWPKTKLVIIEGAQRVIFDQEDVHAVIVQVQSE